MAEANENQEPTIQPEASETQADDSADNLEYQFRNSRVRKAMSQQILEAREAYQKLEAKVAAEEAERKKRLLEEQGNYEAALRESEERFAKELAARDDEVARMQKTIRDSEITNLLMARGVDNPLMVLGAIQMFESSEAGSVSEWFEEFAQSGALDGATQSGQQRHPRPAGVTGQSSRGSMVEQYRTADPSTRQAMAANVAKMSPEKQKEFYDQVRADTINKAKAVHRKR